MFYWAKQAFVHFASFGIHRESLKNHKNHWKSAFLEGKTTKKCLLYRQNTTEKRHFVAKTKAKPLKKDIFALKKDILLQKTKVFHQKEDISALQKDIL
jgi:hypothetical protein